MTVRIWPLALAFFCIAKLFASPALGAERLLWPCASGPLTGDPDHVYRAAVYTDDQTSRYQLLLLKNETHDPQAVPDHNPVVFNGPAEADALGLKPFTFEAGTLKIYTAGNLLRGELRLKSEKDPISLVCWNKNWLVILRYIYWEKDGKCHHARNDQLGRNHFNLPYVRETRDGECTDYKGLELAEGSRAYPELRNWRLAGADLSGARLTSARLVDADLRGADLSGLEIENASLSGTIDANTKLPPGNICRMTELPGPVKQVYCEKRN